jgi:hypothetical protein
MVPIQMPIKMIMPSHQSSCHFSPKFNQNHIPRYLSSKALKIALSFSNIASCALIFSRNSAVMPLTLDRAYKSSRTWSLRLQESVFVRLRKLQSPSARKWESKEERLCCGQAESRGTMMRLWLRLTSVSKRRMALGFVS